jgi:pimeloyl-ACP methyl ester carboxylesterase
MPHVDVNGERLYYETTGQGPPLALIRGLSRSLRFWGPFVDELKAHFTLVLYDHRGIGRSPIAARDFRIKDLASDLASLLLAIGVERAHVLGLSLGGMVAQRLALDHPHRVDKLVLASTTAGGVQSRFPRVDTLAFLALTNRLPVATDAKMQAPRIVSPRAARARPEIASSWIPHLEAEPLDGNVVFHQALAGALHHVYHRLSTLAHETLVITGTADRLIPAINSRRMATRIPRARLVELPGLGHDIVAEEPALVADHVRRFLLAA